MKCKICLSKSEKFADATVVQLHSVSYYKCISCGFVQTEEPYWLGAAYSEAINLSDVGLVRRNTRLATITNVLLTVFFAKNGQFLDFAGGYGLFVRMMRDCGFDFYWFDRYCTNMFAGKFVADLHDGLKYELITAFEVLEHFVDPVNELDEMLKCSRNILFTTVLLPDPTSKPDEWWYYGLEHGQHVSFYTKRSLEVLAEKKGLNFYSNGVTMHLLTEKKLPAALFYMLARYRTASLVAPLLMNKSLLGDDYRSVTGKELH